MIKVPHLLLAAGASQRMGKAKQLLQWEKQTLIEHQINIRLKTKQPLIVILGANAEHVLPIIEKLPIKIFINPKWTRGMGSSLAFGIRNLENIFPDAAGALISLVDQPMITVEHLQKIYNAFQPGKRQIVASQSQSDLLSVPALFDKSYFGELIQLDADMGAGKIIRNQAEFVIRVPGSYWLLADIDTPEDYTQLYREYRKKNEGY